MVCVCPACWGVGAIAEESGVGNSMIVYVIEVIFVLWDKARVGSEEGCANHIVSRESTVS